MGVREQLIFPEIDYDKVEKIRGMEMVFVTTAQDRRRGPRAFAASGHAFPGIRKEDMKRG